MASCPRCAGLTTEEVKNLAKKHRHVVEALKVVQRRLQELPMLYESGLGSAERKHNQTRGDLLGTVTLALTAATGGQA